MAPPRQSSSEFDDGLGAGGSPDGRALDLAALTAERQRESDQRDGPAMFRASSPQRRLSRTPLSALMAAAGARLAALPGRLGWQTTSRMRDGDPAVDPQRPNPGLGNCVRSWRRPAVGRGPGGEDRWVETLQLPSSLLARDSGWRPSFRPRSPPRFFCGSRAPAAADIPRLLVSRIPGGPRPAPGPKCAGHGRPYLIQ